MTSLSEALAALREVSESIIAALEKDRAAVAQYLTSHAEAETAPSTFVEDTHSAGASDAAVEIAHLDAPVASQEMPEDMLVETPAEILAAPFAAEAQLLEVALSEVSPPEVGTLDVGTLDVGQQTAAILSEVVPEALLQAETEVLADAETAPSPTTEIETPTAIVPEAVPATEIVAEPAVAVEIAATEATAANAATVTAEADKSAIEAVIATGDGTVVDLDSRRKARTSAPARRRAIALVACLAITASATLGVNELLHSELGQRILELGTCDGDMLSANRDCALLAWLML